jgi:outer membrane protein assembly factor BamD (BamD/ComL family)
VALSVEMVKDLQGTQRIIRPIKIYNKELNEPMNIPIRNRIFFVMLIFSIILLTISASYGYKEEQVYLSDFELYNQASRLVQRGELHEAENLLSQLVNKYPENVTLMFPYAWCLGQQGKYEQSISYFTKMRNQRPFVLENQLFLVSFGEVLYKSGQYSSARQYLLRALQFGGRTPDFSDKAKSLLSDIEIKG